MENCIFAHYLHGKSYVHGTSRTTGMGEGRMVDGYNGDSIRQDSCGAWILRSQYGNTDSIFGWEIDHVYPVAKGGDDDLRNLRPLQWENNRSKGDDYPSYVVVVQSEENRNVHRQNQYTVNSVLQETLKSLYSI